jgi:hypothetical protein
VKELQSEHKSGAGSPVKRVPDRKIQVAISEAEARIRGCEKGCLRTAEISDKKSREVKGSIKKYQVVNAATWVVCLKHIFITVFSKIIYLLSGATSKELIIVGTKAGIGGAR